MEKMHKSVVIVAGGSGRRMGSDIPKQFLLLNGTPILIHTIRRFYVFNADISIVLVLPENQIEFWASLCIKYDFNIPHQVVSGGDQRFYSVKKGLELIDDKGLVAIHDGVRPLVTNEIIYRGFDIALKSGGALPVVPVDQTLRKVENDKHFVVERNKYRLCQTPQTFRSELLKKAYQQPYNPNFTDDVMVFENTQNNEVVMYDGDPGNIKITSQTDLAIAEILISAQEKKLKTRNLK